MVAVATPSRLQKRSGTDQPRYVYHPSFQDADAEIVYGFATCPSEDADNTTPYMPDDVTRECGRRMHYAAYRREIAGNARERGRWERRYFMLRDRIILGNRKLIYRAVHKWKSVGYQADDLIGECHIVLIRVVATYNPWLGIRFSTFAFTCLMRALSRLWAKITADQTRQPIFLEYLPDMQADERLESPATGRWDPLEEYLRDDHALLSQREKMVLKRRYGLCSQPVKSTLEAVGRDLGLSKERIRQVEKGALDKLRQALGAEVQPG